MDSRQYEVVRHVSRISISPMIERRSKSAVSEADGSGISKVASQRARESVRKVRGKVRMDITWITDRIAVGGGIWNAGNMAQVSQAGITHIIDMQMEFDDTPLANPYGIEVCWNPIDDDFEPKPAEVFERGVEFASAALEDDGAKLFVHCAAGVHRAPMMTLAVLSTMGWRLADAMELIGKRRPAADFAEVYVRSVEHFLRRRESATAR